MHVYGLLAILLVGLLAGFFAHLITGGRGGLIGNLVLGLIGSVIGGFLANFFHVEFFGFWGSVIVSTVGAIVLVFLFGLFTSRTTTV